MFTLVGSQETSDTNFGLLIAYVLPGFTALYGLPFFSDATGRWGTTAGDDPTFAGFLSSTVEAVAVGLVVSAVRWLLIDTLHHRSGLRPPRWDFSLLDRNVEGFEFLVQNHYRYYKFYANMVVALAIAFISGGYTDRWRGATYLALMGLFFLGSRDALGKFYGRAGQLLGSRRSPSAETE